jgi:magnesium-protoporphyrin IX monomethyl ester (oxidative) cyclase
MRTNPKLLRGHNKLWIRFFVLAVFATMYVRDHARPELHKAFGLDPTDYDYKVFAITSEVSKQVFPLTLDIDNPRFRAGLDRLLTLSTAIDALKTQRGLFARLRQLGLMAQAATTFVRLYLLPVKSHELPRQVRLAPAW